MISKGDTFQEGVNCLAADTPEELAAILTTERDVQPLIRESQKLLKPHLDVQW